MSLAETYPPPAAMTSTSTSQLTSFPLPSHPHRIPYALSFFLLGLLNNVLYVVVLSAALDLVGSGVPKVSRLLERMAAPKLTKAMPFDWGTGSDLVREQ